jgi:phenylacetate-coenzyme A ligase PaaK-like adenylate-forming protein
MDYFKSFSSKLNDPEGFDFEEMAMDLFSFQSAENKVYQSFLQARKIDRNKIRNIREIPFLPIQFFKSHPVVCGRPEDFENFYSSSGTTGVTTSRHYIWSEEFYLENAQRIFEQQYGSLRDFHILALLPSYMEREGSSLVVMAHHFINQSDSEHSGFYLYNHEELIRKMALLQDSVKQVLLIGVTFALLDLAEKELPVFSNLMVMETGGMKGRRREMIREEVHEILCQRFNQDKIHSEYGMTELMSQAYSKGSGKYTLPATMRIFLRDTHDPMTISHRSQGGINVIDLANLHSCAFIETQDLGRYDGNGNLEVLGRFDNSEIRGCNLMVN